jgi:hypothetical protein
MQRDIRGIAGILRLLPDRQELKESEWLLGNDNMCRKSAVEIQKDLGEDTFYLHDTRISKMTLQRIKQSNVSANPGDNGQTTGGFASSKSCLDPFELGIWTKINGWITNHGNFFILRTEILAAWLAVLLMILIFGAIVTGGLNKNSKDRQWNYEVPVDPDVYLVIGVFIQVCNFRSVSHQEQAANFLFPLHEVDRRSDRPCHSFHYTIHGPPARLSNSPHSLDGLYHRNPLMGGTSCLLSRPSSNGCSHAGYACYHYTHHVPRILAVVCLGLGLYKL